ncbi:hypothetical protein NUW58_g2272 [Xylaria curta]|uniref:Uncharacterized protein n=1 Tax=Xylaria curta TaxID=42375 RepID=A0ACC1PHR9_9PEZI|nr:hypothetical protein NUW58_g2272 [Xylaria curta]
MPPMSIAPPDFLPVLLGHGSFIKDEDGNVRMDRNGNPHFLIPTTDNFLHMKPSKESQQFWPVTTTRKIPKNVPIVFFSIAVNTDCQKKDIITEIGYTIYDTATIYDGGRSSRRRKIPGCVAPGPRGENITKFALSKHFIVKDTANHHPGTCNKLGHTAQPYHFSYRKSIFINRRQVSEVLDEAFESAACEGLTNEEVEKGRRQVTVLVGWGHENHHPLIQAASWYNKSKFFQHWDIRKYPLVLKSVYNPTYLTCLEAFGIQHRAHGNEIGHNAGNHTAFTIQLLIALCFLTNGMRNQLKSGQNLEPNPKFPGVESALARDNRPPGSGPLPPGRVPITH